MNGHKKESSFGEKAADVIASFGGSWTFIIIFGSIILGWIVFNTYTLFHASSFDPYPYILLNLVLSCVSAIQAPIIMMSQNRQAQRDRHQADADYDTNVKAKEEIEALQVHLARIENEKLDKILEKLNMNMKNEKQPVVKKPRRW